MTDLEVHELQKQLKKALEENGNLKFILEDLDCAPQAYHGNFEVTISFLGFSQLCLESMDLDDERQGPAWC